jgi:hypothetical protein
MDEQPLLKSAFALLKAANEPGLGVQGDALSYLSEAHQTLDFNLERLAYRAGSGKLEGVWIKASQLVVPPLPGNVPGAGEEPIWEFSDTYPLIKVPDRLMVAHVWTRIADRFTHIRADGGRVNWNTAPQGLFALAHRRPPWASMIDRQMERPSPSPSS